MKDVIIIGFDNPSSEGVILLLNKKSTLKSGHILSDKFYVSWDKIGKALIDDYTEEVEVLERDKLRK